MTAIPNPRQFDYHLPEELIAQQPSERRDQSRLLHLPARGEISHHRFDELDRLLRPDDLLVVNNTKVVPVRLIGRKATGGRAEATLLTVPSGRPDNRPVECLLKGLKGNRPGTKLFFNGELEAEVERDLGFGRAMVKFYGPDRPWLDLLTEIGRVPLPPYIRRETAPTVQSADGDRYQTVYADRAGAVAAPTAGLHFTPDLLARLDELGIERVELTLHVGYGTFEPLREHHLRTGRLHAEPYAVSAQTAEAVNLALDQGRRVVAVGTTSVRVLEHLAQTGGVRAETGQTELFITPGYDFRVVGAMVTNFHLPQTSLLMLVSALAGRERILDAYGRAVEEGYRFFSYGDAMLIET